MNPPVSGTPAWASRKKREQPGEHRPARREAAVVVERVVVVAVCARRRATTANAPIVMNAYTSR